MTDEQIEAIHVAHLKTTEAIHDAKIIAVMALDGVGVISIKELNHVYRLLIQLRVAAKAIERSQEILLQISAMPEPKRNRTI